MKLKSVLFRQQIQGHGQEFHHPYRLLSCPLSNETSFFLTSSPKDIFARRGEQKRGPGTRQTHDSYLLTYRTIFSE